MSRLQPESESYRFRLKRWNEANTDFDDSLAYVMQLCETTSLHCAAKNF